MNSQRDIENNVIDITNRPRPPRGELFADAGARAAWAAIKSLDPGLREAVYHSLGQDLVIPEGLDPHERRIAQAVRALREAADILEAQGRDRKVSERQYVRLRGEHPEFGWPPEGSIRRWAGGSWNDALRRAQLEPVPDGDAVRVNIGRAFSRTEVIETLQDYVAETGDRLPTLWRYIGWAKRSDVRERPGRRPTSQGVFDRLFDGWLGALAAAGIAAPVDGSAVPRGRARSGSDGRTVYLRSGYGYTADQIRAALQEVSARLGRSPKVAEYRRERDAILAEEEAADAILRAFPSHSLIQNRYAAAGGWDGALIDAGLAPTDGRHVKDFSKTDWQRSKRISDEEVLKALRDAYEEISRQGGRRLTIKRYQQWRREQLAADREAGRLRRIPEHFCIWERFGRFGDAVAKALEGGETR